jgi:poly-gamma-glutamate synthesis protein (capsule biosynthesis protein)
VVTIALGGDTMLGRMVGAALEDRPPSSVWDPELLDVVHEADLSIVNLECCISRRGEPWPDPDKPFFFRAPPAAVESLLAAGVRAVWLANNHALDYGARALIDTFDHLQQAGIAWAGAGRDLTGARRGAVVEAGGGRIGVVGFADHPPAFAAQPAQPGIAWVDPDVLADVGPPAWLLDEIAGLRARCGVVVVGPHWGPNMRQEPLAHHPDVARALIAAGASIVAGHSAHVAQPVGLVDGAPVCFDLGDLLDDYAIDARLRNDLGLLALFTPGVRLELIPLHLAYARTELARGEDRAWLVDRVRRASQAYGANLRYERGRLVVSLVREARPDAQT